MFKLFIESASTAYDVNNTNNLSLVEHNEEINKKVISEEEAIERDFDCVEFVWTLKVSCALISILG